MDRETELLQRIHDLEKENCKLRAKLDEIFALLSPLYAGKITEQEQEYEEIDA